MINSHFGSLEGLAAQQIVQLFGVQFRSVKKVRASRGWGKLVHGDVVKAYSQWVPTMRVQGLRLASFLHALYCRMLGQAGRGLAALMFRISCVEGLARMVDDWQPLWEYLERLASLHTHTTHGLTLRLLTPYQPCGALFMQQPSTMATDLL